jgi:hypothetical protein
MKPVSVDIGGMIGADVRAARLHEGSLIDKYPPGRLAGRRRIWSGSGMTNEKDRDGVPRGTGTPDSRQDRLKLALRENLKRRKSQARGRSEQANVPANAGDDAPHGGGKASE